MRLNAGQVYYLQGKSGSGKSLFLKSLLNLVSSNFKATINGKIGYVEPHLFHLKNYLNSINNKVFL